MKDKRNFLDEYTLAFIEELQQGCTAFKFACDDKFIENEYPHYATKFERAMKKVYKLWKSNDDSLGHIKGGIIKKVGQTLSDKIESDKFLRFLILKSFHDSQINGVFYDKEKSALRLKLDYDDAFCKIPYGNNLTLAFYGVENYECDTVCDDDCCLVIGDLWYEIENGKVKLIIDCMDTYNDWNDFKLSFLYERAEIS